MTERSGCGLRASAPSAILTKLASRKTYGSAGSVNAMGRTPIQKISRGSGSMAHLSSIIPRPPKSRSTTPTTPTIPDVPNDLSGSLTSEHLGQRVCIDGVQHGVLRYFGTTEFQTGIWCGIQCEGPVGKHNGSVQGKRYFYCPDNYGIFAPLSKVSLAHQGSEMATNQECSDNRITATKDNNIGTTATPTTKPVSSETLRPVPDSQEDVKRVSDKGKVVQETRPASPLSRTDSEEASEDGNVTGQRQEKNCNRGEGKRSQNVNYSPRGQDQKRRKLEPSRMSWSASSALKCPKNSHFGQLPNFSQINLRDEIEEGSRVGNDLVMTPPSFKNTFDRRDFYASTPLVHGGEENNARRSSQSFDSSKLFKRTPGPDETTAKSPSECRAEDLNTTFCISPLSPGDDSNKDGWTEGKGGGKRPGSLGLSAGTSSEECSDVGIFGITTPEFINSLALSMPPSPPSCCSSPGEALDNESSLGLLTPSQLQDYWNSMGAEDELYQHLRSPSVDDLEDFEEEEKTMDQDLPSTLLSNLEDEGAEASLKSLKEELQKEEDVTSHENPNNNNLLNAINDNADGDENMEDGGLSIRGSGSVSGYCASEPTTDSDFNTESDQDNYGGLSEGISEGVACLKHRNARVIDGALYTSHVMSGGSGCTCTQPHSRLPSSSESSKIEMISSVITASASSTSASEMESSGFYSDGSERNPSGGSESGSIPIKKTPLRPLRPQRHFSKSSTVSADYDEPALARISTSGPFTMESLRSPNNQHNLNEHFEDDTPPIGFESSLNNTILVHDGNKMEEGDINMNNLQDASEHPDLFTGDGLNISSSPSKEPTSSTQKAQISQPPPTKEVSICSSSQTKNKAVESWNMRTESLTRKEVASKPLTAVKSTGLLNEGSRSQSVNCIASLMTRSPSWPVPSERGALIKAPVPPPPFITVLERQKNSPKNGLNKLKNQLEKTDSMKGSQGTGLNENKAGSNIAGVRGASGATGSGAGTGRGPSSLLSGTVASKNRRASRVSSATTTTTTTSSSSVLPGGDRERSLNSTITSIGSSRGNYGGSTRSLASSIDLPTATKSPVGAKRINKWDAVMSQINETKHKKIDVVGVKSKVFNCLKTGNSGDSRSVKGAGSKAQLERDPVTPAGHRNGHTLSSRSSTFSESSVDEPHRHPPSSKHRNKKESTKGRKAEGSDVSSASDYSAARQHPRLPPDPVKEPLLKGPKSKAASLPHKPLLKGQGAQSSKVQKTVPTPAQNIGDELRKKKAAPTPVHTKILPHGSKGGPRTSTTASHISTGGKQESEVKPLRDRNGGCWKGGFSGTEVVSQGLSQAGLIHAGENATKEKIDETERLVKEIAALKADRDRLTHHVQISDNQSAALCFVVQYEEKQREFAAEVLGRECGQRDVEIERLGGEVSALSKELGVQLECHREEVAELVKSHEEQLNTVIREHEDQLQKLRKKEESIQEVRQQHLKEIQSLKESHRLELEESNNRHRQLLEAHTKQSPHDLLVKEVASLQVVVEMRNGELRECRKELIGYQTTKEDLSSCQEQVKTRQAKIEDLEAQLEKGRSERRIMAEHGRDDEERILGLESQNSELTRVIDKLRWQLQNNCRDFGHGGQGECHDESHKDVLEEDKLAK